MLPGGLAELPQAHVVPAFDHFSDFDFVGIAYVCVSHSFPLLQFIYTNVAQARMFPSRPG